MQNKLFNFRVLPLALLFLVVGSIIGALLPTVFGYVVIALGTVFCISVFIPSFSRLLFKDKAHKAKTFCVFCNLFLVIGICGALISFAVIEDRNLQQNDITVNATITGESYHSTDGVVDKSRTIFAKISIVDNASTNAFGGGDYLDANAKRLDGYSEIIGLELCNEQLKVGDVITLKGSIRSNVFDPADSYDMSNYQKKRYYVFYADELLSYNEGKRQVNDLIADKTREVLLKNTDDKTANFVFAMLFGDKYYLDSQVKNDFQFIGAAHVFAVSGLHVGILAAAILFILKKCRLNILFRTVILAAILAFYAYLCDFSPSVLRASIMILVVMLTKIIGVRNDDLSTVSLVAILLLLIRPFNLFSIGFMMSFMAVFALAFFAKPLQHLFCKCMPKFMALPLAANLAVNIGLLPIMMYYFASMSLLTIPANLIIIPLMSIIFPFVFPAVIIGMIPHMGWLITAVCFPFKLIVLFGSFMSNIPFLKFTMQFNWSFNLLYFALMSLVSRFSLLTNFVKKILSVIMAAWAVSSAVMSVADIALPTGSVSASYVKNTQTNIALFKEEQGTNAIINGTVNKESLYDLKQIMLRHSISSLNALILHGLTDEESILIAEFTKSYPIKTVVSDTIGELNERVDVLWQDNLAEGYVSCESLFKGAMVYINKSGSFLFLDDNVKDVPVDLFSFDLVFSNKLAFENNVKHGVKYGELDNKPNYGFTIYFNNGKIKLIKLKQA